MCYANPTKKGKTDKHTSVIPHVRLLHTAMLHTYTGLLIRHACAQTGSVIEIGFGNDFVWK